MNNILKALNDDFVIVDLGSSAAKNNSFLRDFFPAITLIEIDALVDSNTSSHSFFKNVRFKKGIHTSTSTATFYERRWYQCSSFLKIKAGISEMYGQEEGNEIINEIPMDCTTLPEILQGENIHRIHLLKTDLEGLDAAVLKSAEEYLGNTLVIQSELRFQQFYEGEPLFYEVCAYLDKFGFELISIASEKWKYNTSNRALYRDGRLVWGDFIFFRKPDIEHTDFPGQLLRQILLARSMSLNAHAEYLFEKHGHVLSNEVADELRHAIRPGFSFGNIITRLFNVMSRMPGYFLLRNGIKNMHSKSSVDAGKFPWWAGS